MFYSLNIVSTSVSIYTATWTHVSASQERMYTHVRFTSLEINLYAPAAWSAYNGGWQVYIMVLAPQAHHPIRRMVLCLVQRITVDLMVQRITEDLKVSTAVHSPARMAPYQWLRARKM